MIAGAAEAILFGLAARAVRLQVHTNLAPPPLRHREARARLTGVSAVLGCARIWTLNVLTLVFLAVLGGCTSSPAAQHEAFDPRRDALFDRAVDVVTIDEAHALTSRQQEDFLTYFLDPRIAHTPAHERVYGYLERVTNNFTYQDDTFTAAVTFNQRRGNCMSLAVLTTALARLAGVRVQYQLVDADPVYDLARGIAVHGEHVRTLLIDSEWQAAPGEFTLRKPGLIVDYFPSGNERFVENLDDGAYAARFYLNLAVEKLEQNDLAQSYWLTAAALERDGDSVDALNMLAVIYRRRGSLDSAERVYQHAIGLAPDKLVTLRNYELMLSSLNRDAEARAVRSRLRRLEDPSPFSWVRGARQAFARGELVDAEYFYQRAIERAPYMPELRYGLAEVLVGQGRYLQAQTELERSLDYLRSASSRQPYKAKLHWLRWHEDE